MPGHFLIFTSPIVVILCCCAALIDITSGASVEEYKLLQSTLLTNYSTSIRPLLDQDDTVFVYSGFYLAGINEVDAVNQRLITTGFLELSWDDEFLQWDEDEFDIHTLYFKQVWGIVKIQLLLKEQQTHHQKKITYIYCIMEIVVLLLLQNTFVPSYIAQTELCFMRNNLRHWQRGQKIQKMGLYISLYTVWCYRASWMYIPISKFLYVCLVIKKWRFYLANTCICMIRSRFLHEFSRSSYILSNHFNKTKLLFSIRKRQSGAF